MRIDNRFITFKETEKEEMIGLYYLDNFICNIKKDTAKSVKDNEEKLNNLVYEQLDDFISYFVNDITKIFVPSTTGKILMFHLDFGSDNCEVIIGEDIKKWNKFIKKMFGDDDDTYTFDEKKDFMIIGGIELDNLWTDIMFEKNISIEEVAKIYHEHVIENN